MRQPFWPRTRHVPPAPRTAWKPTTCLIVCFGARAISAAAASLSKLTSGRGSACAQHNRSMRGSAGHNMCAVAAILPRSAASRTARTVMCACDVDALTRCQSAWNHLQAHPLPNSRRGVAVSRDATTRHNVYSTS